MGEERERKKVIVIGGGFGGLSAANKLRRQADVDVLVIDRNNFHTFTPLLYQVATSALDASEIAYPIRSIYRGPDGVRFQLGEVVDIQHDEKRVVIKVYGELQVETYDYLVVAAGAVTNFLNNDRLERFAFGLKDLHDSITLRNHILRLFEKAAWEQDETERAALTTLVVVGGGPTGLETAGALYELYNHVMAKEYNGDANLHARVILVELADSVLTMYPEKLQESALKQLEDLGVEVMLQRAVKDVDRGNVYLNDGSTIRTNTLVWAAGVTGSPLAERVGVELQRGRRIPVEPTMEVVNMPDMYAIGDIAYLENADGKPYPQVIPVAQQQGALAARNILRRLRGEAQQAFKYRDRGLMATIGRRRAVAWPFYRLQLTGFLAWVSWLALHLMWLMGFRNRLRVFINWVWNYFTYDRSVRIIYDRIEKEGTLTEKPYIVEQETQEEAEERKSA